MNKKLKDFQEGFIEQQYKIIDELAKYQDQLNLNDRKDGAVYHALNGILLGVVFRLKGVIESIKEVNGENIEVLEKYQNLFKTIKEPAYFKGDDLIVLLAGEKGGVEENIKDFFDKLKASKNGRQPTKDDTKDVK